MNKKGFTLIEMLVALSLSIVFLGAAFFILNHTLKFANRQAIQSAKQQTELFVLNKLSRDIQASQSISPLSTKDRLILYIESDKIEYLAKNNKICRVKNGYSSYITDINEINVLEFYYPKPDLVKIKMGTLASAVVKRN